MTPSSRRCLKVCCLVTAIIILLLIVTLVILYFTILKPKKPEIIATPVSVQQVEIGIFPPLARLTLGVEIYIKNPNHAGFMYKNSTALLYYCGEFVGQSPFDAGVIQARATQKISTSVEILVDKVVASPCFKDDFRVLKLNLSSSTSVDGKAIVFKVFKLHARTSVACDITVFLLPVSSNATCSTKISV